MPLEFPKTFPSQYGLCFVPMGFAWVLNIIQTAMVVKARLKYDIKYPLLYAPPDHKDATAFNCVQRCHQNYLETVNLVMISVFTTGLVYPVSAFRAGMSWVLSRYIYVAYALGNPRYRLPGVLLSRFGEFWLVGMTIRIGYKAFFGSS